jgi:hypothetical protein
MDKMKLDNLIRRYTIHYEDESYIEMKDLKTMFEDLCKDELLIEKRIVPALQWECGYYSYLILLYHVFLKITLKKM